MVVAVFPLALHRANFRDPFCQRDTCFSDREHVLVHGPFCRGKFQLLCVSPPEQQLCATTLQPQLCSATLQPQWRCRSVRLGIAPWSRKT